LRGISHGSSASGQPWMAKNITFALARPMTIKGQRFASGTIEVAVVSGQNAQAAARKEPFDGPSCHGELWPSGGYRRTESSLEAAKQRCRDREWQQYNAEIVEILSPVPKKAPPIDWAYFSEEPLSLIHEYKNENDTLLHYVAQRVDLLRGKLYYTAVLGKCRDGQLKWIVGEPTKPRALYGLEQLRRMPDADVLIVEGEKTADAARKLFPQSLVLTWYGGPHATDFADWTPLQRYRHVTLWADNDDEGKKAMQQIEATLARLGVKKCKTVLVPSNFPNSWDLADPIPEGHDVLEIMKRTTA
jgi:hypothetical protein